MTTIKQQSENGTNLIIEEIQQLVLDWAEEKDLLDPDNYTKQTMKLMEEVGEFTGELCKNQREKAFMELGDILVVLTILSHQLNMNMTEAINAAYEKIKARKGKKEFGIFIKEE